MNGRVLLRPRGRRRTAWVHGGRDKQIRDLPGSAAGSGPHDLRRWTATTAITGGHDVRTVAGRLGHANAAMTLRVYAHAVAAADETLAQTLGAALEEPPVAQP